MAPFRNAATIFFILAIELDAAAARNTASLSSGLSLTENMVCSTITSKNGVLSPSVGNLKTARPLALDDNLANV